MEKTERTCGTCAHWLPGKTNAEMRSLLLMLCRLNPRWTFFPAQSACARHVPASDKAVAARKRLLPL